MFLIAYNLACYASVLGDLAESHTLLRIAFDMEPGLRMTALDDPDLDPVFGHGSPPADPPSTPPPSS